MSLRKPAMAAALATVVTVLAAGCSSGTGATATADSNTTITAVGAENEYANVISQIGGKYVHVTAIESNPNTDPHSFEASASVAQLVSSAGLVVQNGLGYDTLHEQDRGRGRRTPAQGHRRAALCSACRTARLTRTCGTSRPPCRPWPRRWPATWPRSSPPMPATSPPGRPRSTRPCSPGTGRSRSSRPAYPGTPVAATEPVGDYLLQAAGTRNLTPFALPGRRHERRGSRRRSTCHCRTACSPAQGQGVPVQPAGDRLADRLVPGRGAPVRHPGGRRVRDHAEPGYSYQSWMLAETRALQRAVASTGLHPEAE